MLKTYKESEAAWVEGVPKIYDTASAARIEALSAKTYDTATAAWVDRLVRDNLITPLAFSFGNGGGYTVSPDKRTITFTFKQGSLGVDSASVQWEGKAVTNSVLIGSFETADATLNPDVYFYYQGEQVLATKLRTQEDNLFGIPYSGAVDKIWINIVPYNACTFSLVNLWFGQALKFEV